MMLLEQGFARDSLRSQHSEACFSRMAFDGPETDPELPADSMFPVTRWQSGNCEETSR